MDGESAYKAVSVEEAAAALEQTPERVREMLAAGELEGIPPGATAQGAWKVLLPATPDPQQAAPPDETPDTRPEEPQEVPAAGEGPDEFVEPPPPSAVDAENLPAESEEPSEKLSRGDGEDTSRQPTAPSGWVSTQQAARALGISPRTVRWHIEQGNLEAKPEGEGVRRAWLVSIDSLQAFRDTRQDAGHLPGARRASSGGAEVAADSPGNAVRELADRLAEEAAKAAEYRVRLELTEQAASSVQAQLEEERRRREAAERERDELRRQLELELEETRPEPQEMPPAPAPAPAPASVPAPERAEEPQGAGLQEPAAGSQRGSVPRSWWRRMFRRGAS